MREVGLLRLADQEQRDGEDGERVRADEQVAERHHAADEAVREVVREEPGEPLAPDRPPALVALEREGERDERVVHDEVGRSGREADHRDRDIGPELPAG